MLIQLVQRTIFLRVSVNKPSVHLFAWLSLVLVHIHFSVLSSANLTRIAVRPFDCLVQILVRMSVTLVWLSVRMSVTLRPFPDWLSVILEFRRVGVFVGGWVFLLPFLPLLQRLRTGTSGGWQRRLDAAEEACFPPERETRVAGDADTAQSPGH